MRTAPAAAAGEALEPREFGPLTQTDIVRFAGAGGDFNPLHHDAEFAASAGFERPIAMGQFTAGLLAAWLTDWCGVGNLRSYGVRFTSPLAIGETIAFSGTVDSTEPLQDGLALARLTLSADCGDRQVVSAHADVVVKA